MKKQKASNTVKCALFLGHVLTKHCTQVTCRDKGVHQMWRPNMFVIVTFSYLVGVHLRTPPVVQVILQIPITDAKLQLLQEFFVLHKVQCIKHIKTHLQCSVSYINVKKMLFMCLKLKFLICFHVVNIIYVHV